jgi:hypothetical protein
MPLEENIEAETKRLAGAPLATQRVSDIEVSRRRLRIFLANRAIALGWALKGSCKPCAHRLFTTARWLVPEAQRFLVHCTGSHNRTRRIFEWLLSRIQPRVVGGFLIVLAFVGLLDLAMRTTAMDTQPLVENSAFRHEPQIPSESKIVSVRKSSELMQGFVLETASLSGAQIAPVPLPLRKPERVYKVPNGKGAKANLATQKRMAQQKGARPKPMR